MGVGVGGGPMNPWPSFSKPQLCAMPLSCLHALISPGGEPAALQLWSELGNTDGFNG